MSSSSDLMRSSSPRSGRFGSHGSDSQAPRGPQRGGRLLWAALALMGALPPGWASAAGPDVTPFLYEGRLAEGRDAFLKHLANEGDDHQARFDLGLIESLQALEHFAQAMHHHGLENQPMRIPFLRLPVPSNPEPKPLDYVRFRGILQALIDDLATAEKTFAQVDGDVKRKLDLAKVRIDIDGDGAARSEETFASLAAPILNQTMAPGLSSGDEEREVEPEELSFVLAFDRADGHWFRAYTHLLRAVLEAYLAHDTEAFFDITLANFFSGAQTPLEAFAARADRPEKPAGAEDASFEEMGHAIAEAIAALHLMRFEVTEPERMSRARTHLLSMIEQSRQTFVEARKETDDDHEWIPNANQTAPFEVQSPNVPVMTRRPDGTLERREDSSEDQASRRRLTDEQIDAWLAVLDGLEDVLEGKKLVPHWRFGRGGVGINVRQVFERPARLDLVMWLHGQAALPYMEEGERTDPEHWMETMRSFQGNFPFFAIWVN